MADTFYEGEAGSWEVTNTQRSVTKNASHFFNKLEKDIQDKADKVVHAHVLKMRDTLRFRMPLGKGDGRYPRWDYLGSAVPNAQGKQYTGDKTKSKESYKFWKVAAYEKGKYKLFNNAQDPATGYAYPLNLVNGTGWRKDISRTGPYDRLVFHNGKLFSRQMPRGLEPWLGRKKTELKKKLKEQLGVKV